MKLLFDLGATQPNRGAKRHGAGRYGEVIFCRMVEKGLQFGAFYNSRKWLNPDIKAMAERGGIPLHDKVQRSVQQIIDDEGYTRVYSCLPGRKFGKLKGMELIGTLHGLRRLETPLDNCFWDYKNPLLKKLDFILKRAMPGFYKEKEQQKFRRRYFFSGMKTIVVSEHTKHAVLAFFPEMKDREIEVFYSPNTSAKDENEGQQTRKRDGTPYMLLVSGNRWEKNNLRAIEAFDRLLSAGLISDMRMVVTGAKDASIYRYKVRSFN